jgi:hypothetical protein
MWKTLKNVTDIFEDRERLQEKFVYSPSGIAMWARAWSSPLTKKTAAVKALDSAPKN